MTILLATTALVAFVAATSVAQAKSLPACKLVAVSMSQDLASAGGAMTASAMKPEGTGAVATASGAKPEGTGAVATASGDPNELLRRNNVTGASAAKPEGTGAVATASSAKPEGAGAVATAPAPRGGAASGLVAFKFDTTAPCEIRIPVAPGK